MNGCPTGAGPLPPPARGASRLLLARVCLPAVFTLLCPAAARGSDWPGFRGPRHDGISPDRGFRKAWTAPPEVLWQRELGAAFSSFAIVGERIYTCGAEEKQQVVYCLDRGTGKIVWMLPFEQEITDPDARLYGTRATPTFSDGRVYVLGGHGRLLCLDAATGSIQWERQLRHKPQWGYAGSVLIEGDLAILSPGKSEGALCALDKRTGREVWRCGDDGAGYATPYSFTLDGRRYVCAFCYGSAIGADLSTGRKVFEIPWPAHAGVNAAMPMVQDNHLLLSSGYAVGCAVFKLTVKGDRIEPTEVWRSKALKNKFQTPVLFEGHLYGCDEVSLKCVEFLTGQTRWRKGGQLRRNYAHGTVLLADGYLILLTEKGQLQIAPASTERFEPTATAQILDGRCWTAPVLLDGLLYARNHTRMVCLDLRADEKPDSKNSSASARIDEAK